MFENSSFVILTDSQQYNFIPVESFSSTAGLVNDVGDISPINIPFLAAQNEDLQLYTDRQNIQEPSNLFDQVTSNEAADSSRLVQNDVTNENLLLRRVENSDTYFTPDGQEVRVIPVVNAEQQEHDEPVRDSSPDLQKINSVDCLTENANQIKKGKKPQRPCPYCPDLKMQSNLKRHILRKHGDEVKHIANSSPQKQRKEFKKIRLNGVFEYNKHEKLHKGKEAEVQRARKGNKNPVLKMCSECHIFVSKKTFRKHKCINKSPMKVSSAIDITPSLTTSVTVKDYLNGCVSKLLDDEVGTLIKDTPLLLFLGEKFFLKTNNAKKIEKRRRVNAYLRKMGLIYLNFKKKKS